MFARRLLSSLVVVSLSIGCSDTAGPDAERFLIGTVTNPGVALMISSSRNSLLMLQTGSPSTRSEIPLGSSTAVTPVDFAVRGSRAIIPLGNAASVALADLATARVERFFAFPAGNVTGGTWLSDDIGIACSASHDYCGRFSVSQASTDVTDTVHVTAYPNAVVTVGARIFVVSSNIDDAGSFAPIDNGVVTELDPVTLDIVRTFTVGRNPQFAAVGPDGNIYVPNSGDYGESNGSLSVIDLSENTVETIPGFGDFPGDISIDKDGRAFISSFSVGTVVWHTTTRTFVRDASNPICAPVTGGSCRGASSAEIGPDGNLYQAFFGSAFSNTPAYLFVYNGTTLELSDSISIPVGPSGLTVRSFR